MVFGWDGCHGKKGNENLDKAAGFLLGFASAVPMAIEEHFAPSRLLSKFYEWKPMKPKLSNLLLALVTMTAAPLTAQTVTVLHTLTNAADGTLPWPKLALSGNTLFGTTDQGGTNADQGGTIFSLGTDGSGFTVLRSFNFSTDGDGSQGGLTVAGGILYGSAAYGGSNLMGGTLFSMNTNGSNFTVLHNFDPPQTIYIGKYISTNADGWIAGGLLLSGGTLYGATGSGGSGGSGTIFSLATNGSNFTVLHTFPTGFGVAQQGTNSDGVAPTIFAISGGKIFGTATYGGTNGAGTLFSISTAGSNFTVLHTFGNGVLGTSANYITNLDGWNPMQAYLTPGGTLFGTTQTGGLNGGGVLFAMNTNGSNYQTFANFLPTSVPLFPRLNWVISGNTAYGAVTQGGANREGTIFSTPAAPVLTGITFAPLAGATINFSGAPNNLYFVQSAASISTPGAWQTISTNVSDTNGFCQVTDTNAVLSRSQFYRAVLP